MLLLQLHAAGERYAMESNAVIEVLPAINLHQQADLAPPLAGVFNYRGAAIPVIDLTRALHNQAASIRMTTRIVVVEHDGEIFGILAEGVTELLRMDADAFAQSPRISTSTKCLKGIKAEGNAIICRLHLAELHANICTGKTV